MARILVVDDDIIIRELIRDSLRKYSNRYYTSSWDLDIDVVADAITALGLVKDNNYELIITDILMAKMDGWEFIKELRKRFPLFKVPIFVISAISGIELEYQAVKYGVSRVFGKPLSPKLFSKEVFSFLTDL